MLLRATILVTNRWNRSHLSWVFSTFLPFTLHTFVRTHLMCCSPTEMTAIPNQHWGRGKSHKCFNDRGLTTSSNHSGKQRHGRVILKVQLRIKKGSMANKKACLLKFSLTRSLVMEPKGRRLHLTSPKSLKFSRQVCPQIPLEAQRLGPSSYLASLWIVIEQSASCPENFVVFLKILSSYRIDSSISVSSER